MLYLDKTLYKAFIKLQSDKGLGRSYAGLLGFVEGLYHMGYLTDGEHEEHAKKYSVSLYDDVVKPTSMEEAQEKSEVSSWEKRFSRAIVEWAAMNEKSQCWYIEKARELEGKVSSAKLILKLSDAIAKSPTLPSRGNGRNDDKLERALGHMPPKVEG